MNNPKNIMIVNNNKGETIKFESNLPEERDMIIKLLLY